MIHLCNKNKFSVATTVVAILLLMLLSGCQTSSLSSNSKDSSSGSLGSNLGLLFDKKKPEIQEDPSSVFLDVMLITFDPGLPEDSQSYKEENIWPELRRAEANRFPLKLKESLENTSAFGAVRVVPNDQVAGELYVFGKILQSNAKEIKFELDIRDSLGNVWDKKIFEHEIEESFHQDPRNDHKDSYQPAFDEAAQHIVRLLKKHSKQELTNIKHVTNIKFASAFSQETFGQYLGKDKNEKIELLGLPADNDPMYARIERLREHDNAFIDKLQSNYKDFTLAMNESYHLWQKEALLEHIARQEAERDAMIQKGLSILSVAGAVASIIAGANTNVDTSMFAIGLGGAAVYTWNEGQNLSAQSEYHRDNLHELGDSLQLSLGKQVVTLEDTVVELQGSAKEQYMQWRTHLKRIFDAETTPDVVL